MVFGHVVYSWVCKHLYLYARSRRTSGLLWRPVSGPRPPLPYAAARFSLPVPRASRPRRLRTTCAAPIKPSATRRMRSTIAVARRCSRNRHAPIPSPRSLPLASARPCGRCCTRAHARSASRRAGGPSRWPPRSASPKGSHPGSSATKPFGWPSAACGCRGSEPNIGSPVPIRRMLEKKTARPAHPANHGSADMGPGLWRRGLVESPGPAQSTWLDGRRSHIQAAGTEPADG